MNYETIRSEISNRILTITLDRPERLNAFTVKMADELIHAFSTASVDDAVRAVIVTGNGRAFCAGMDLSVAGNVFGLDESLRPTMRDLDERLNDPVILRSVRDTGGRVTLAIFDCTKPVIAAINGIAVGVGATLPLAMDVRFAAEEARFGYVFGKIGIVPDACSSWFLPKIVGLAKALEWTYSGEIIDAHEARRCGLVSEVVPAAQLLDHAREFARRLANERSLVSTALIRQMMYRNSALPDPLTAHKVESLGIFYTSLADGKEGVAAFREKRAAAFRSETADMPDFYPWWR
jgi:enoyl-CoA hydratase/carnithine racemase